MNPFVRLFKEKLCDNCHKFFKPLAGNQKFCTICIPIKRKLYKSIWAEKNRERLNQESKERYFNNLAKSRAIKRKYNNTHPERHNNRILKPLTAEQRKKIINRGQARRIAKKAEMIKKCIVIGEHSKGIDLHHRDKNTANNNLNNLVYLCRKHHAFIHRKPLP